MNPMPISDATAPIACTASSEEIPVRIEQVERMRTYLDRLERTAHGLLLHFPNRPDIDADLRKFAVDEKRCCTFWGFAVSTNDHQLTLRWDGPLDVEHFFEQLVAFFEGDEPLSAISGLL
ncbi:MAG: hypothetical protein ACT4PW_03720 [Acidimicrobiia bacterium]